MGSDQLWKEVIWTFFERFMRLFFPRVADDLDFSTMHLEGVQLFTDVLEGDRREPDIVVRVNRRDGEPEIVLVHVEVQSERRDDVPYRMWEYYSLLRLRKKLPVFPIVVFLAPGAGGLVSESYCEALFGKHILDFAYEAVGLPDLAADAYIGLDDPLAVSLSALMRSPQGNRVKRKLQALDRLISANMDEARTWLLTYVVDKYLVLTEKEEEEMSQLSSFDPASPERFKQGLMNSWEKAGWDRAHREVIVRQLRLKFGDAATPVVDQIMAIDDSSRLAEIADRILTAATIDDLGLA